MALLGRLGRSFGHLGDPRLSKMVARRIKVDPNQQGERSERASEASDASGAIRMNLDVCNGRDAKGAATM